MFESLKLSFGLSETEMFSTPAPMPRPDALPATTDWAGRPYRPFWAALRGVEKTLDGLLIDRPDARRRALARSLTMRSARWGTAHQLKALELAPRAASETFKFVVVGDAEPGRFKLWQKLWNQDGVFARQLKSIGSRPHDFVMQLGDMVSRGLPEQYDAFLSMLEAAGLPSPYLTVLGNHDRHYPHGTSHSKVYRQIFGKPNYAFDRGVVRFVVLDTSEEGLTQARLRWLDKVLAGAKRKIVFTHKPPRQFTRWTSAGIGGFSQGSAAFLRLMSQHHVDRVYLGHIHGFGVHEHRGVRYILTGGGGSPLFPSGAPQKFHHHVLVEAGPQGLRETVMRLDGTSFSLPVWG